MKTVIVIDTEDPTGMESTRLIVDHLMKTHHKIPYDSNDPFGTKIQAIKTIRQYVRFCKEHWPDDWQDAIGSLRASKSFVDTLTNAKFSTRF